MMTEMEEEHNREPVPGNSDPVLEKNLFHGTCVKYVRQICKSGFDWRLSGVVNGANYGDGMYIQVNFSRE